MVFVLINGGEMGKMALSSEVRLGESIYETFMNLCGLVMVNITCISCINCTNCITN